MDKPESRYYRFGPFVLSMADRVLHFGDTVVPLAPKLVDMLFVLIENSGHVVTKQELREKLWPDTYVEESSLTQTISLLRKALAEYSEGEHYIETVSKRGYRFVGRVSQADSPAQALAPEKSSGETFIEATIQTRALQSEPARHWRRWKHHIAIAGFGILLIIGTAYLISRRNNAEVESSEIGSLAVLPFKTLGQEADEPIGLGIANSIILRLSSHARPYTLPTSSIYKYTNNTRDVLSIGRDLGVEGVLDGTVQRSEGRIRVTAQLLRVRDGKTLWVGKFDEEFENIFQVQDSISERLAETLMPRISRDKQQLDLGFTRNTEAYQSFSLGLYFFSKGSGDIIKSIPHFEQAMAQDPSFVLAYVMLADAYYYNAATNGTWAKFLGISLPSNDESRRLAWRNLAMAMSLNPNIAQTHTVMAGLKTLEGDYAGAEGEYKLALDLNPNYATGHTRYGIFLFHMSDIEGAVAHLRKAQLLDPASPVTNTGLAQLLVYDRKYDEAIHYAGRALQLEPTQDGIRLILGEAYSRKGSYQEAITIFEQILGNSSSAYISPAKANLAIICANSERGAEARKLLADVLSLKTEGRTGRFGRCFAEVYAALGEETKAIECLEKEKYTRYLAARLKFDPFLDRLRNAPRFKKLLERPPATEYQ